MQINTNIAAMNAYRNLNQTETKMDQSLERLSSGLRINRAADDAAGLSISEKMRGQISGLDQAASNAQDGISLIQTAEGALDESHSILQRMRELAVQSANDTLTASDRIEIQREIDQMADELNRIGNTTEFNTKNLLDGSASALVSTSDVDTNVHMRGSVEEGGNYDINITDVEQGNNHIQKTDILTAAHDIEQKISYVSIGLEDEGELHIGNLTADEMEVVLDPTQDGVVDWDGENTLTIGTENGNVTAEDIIDEIQNIEEITFDSTDVKDLDAAVEDGASDTLTLDPSRISGDFQTEAYESLDEIGGSLNIAALTEDVTIEAEYKGVADVEVGVTGNTIRVGFGDDHGEGQLLTALRESEEATKLIDIQGEADDGAIIEAGEVEIEALNYADQGDIVGDQAPLEGIDRFYDASGNFMLDEPADIELVMGDGNRAAVTLYEQDTIADVVEKFNNAIHEGLNQQRLGESLSEAYAQYVDPGQGTDDNHFSTEGTLVFQSAVAGNSGEISFLADEDILNALSLETIQEPTETKFTVDVSDSHTGEEIVSDVEITGNTLRGVIHENVDVEFYHSAGIEKVDELPTEEAADNDAEYEIVETEFDENSEEATQQVHIAENSMVFHIGANPMQNLDASIGDMRADALGVENLLVTNQDAANRAIEQIDQAIEKISSERALTGAMQNRLEHTISNLSVAEENLTAAESRIRDLDMAEEMVDFTRHQIMMQAGSSMLAQANMKPENVLALFG